MKTHCPSIKETACLGALLLSLSCFGQPLKSLDPPVLLPDGTEFKTWEAPLNFTRTYYVDGSNPKASDANPGTKARPFATINQAAQVLGPGERVLVAAGVYRERIRPARGGAGPRQMISYEAAPGAQVVLKGSREFREPWTPADSASPTRVWQARLEPKYFAGYNPFDLENVTPRQFDIMDFARPLRGTAPCNLPRGLLFQAGRRLAQVAKRSDLEGREGSYWVDRANQLLYAHFFGGARPGQAALEITTQETVFAPEQPGLGFIRVKGFTVEQAAGPFPWEQVGAISTTRGRHWIIEDNTVRQVNGVGIDVGIQLHQWPQPPLAGFHLVRRNTVTDCGICGICGLGPGGSKEFGLLIEDNVLLRNAFHDVERLYETAAIKTHNNVRCLIRRNRILDTYHGAGIWMDWDNRNSRCCQNLIINAQTIHGGIFVEASPVPNLIDQNFIWDTQGHGLYEHDCSHQIFAHNFIGQSAGSGLRLHGKITDRRIDGHQPEYGLHQVRNNLLYQNAKTNVFGGQPSTLAGNLSAGLQAAFNREKLELTISATHPLPPCEPVPGVSSDFFGKPRPGPTTIAGPFARLPAKVSKVVLARQPFPAPPAPDITLTVDTGTVRHTMRGGFGASWHAIEQPIPVEGNRSHGGSAWGANPPAEDTRAWRQLSRHADWLGLDFVRVELEQRMFEPELDWYSWDAPEMRILYRILDWCQSRHADVFLQCMWGNVDWNAFPEFRGDPVKRVHSGPYSMERFADGLAALLKHLVTVKHYTCIRWLCINNEPGYEWSWWQRPPNSPMPLREGLAAVRAALDREGLRVPLSGPDWTDLPELKPEQVDFDAFLGAYDLHSYYAGFDWRPGGGYPLAVAEKRLTDWRQWSAARGKPLFLSEVGTMNFGWGGSHPGPSTWEAAIKDAELVVRALNLGVDGFNRWSFVNRGDLDGVWQMINTWDPARKALQKTITPCPNAYFVYGLISRLAAKHSSVVACDQSGGQVNGTNRVFAAALKSPGGDLTWMLVNDAPREWAAELSLKGCARPALYKYQVTPEQKDRPELQINPRPAAPINAGQAAFTDRLPPMSLTIYSTWKLKHSAPGIMEDSGP